MTSTYRRKQDAILGLDNSNLASPSDTLANAVARYETGELDGKNILYHDFPINLLIVLHRSKK